MSERVRVYELARELGLTNKELLALLKEEGLEVSSHSSAIERDFADLVRDHVIAKRQAEAERRAGPVAVEAEEPASEEVPVIVTGVNGERELHLKPPVIVRDLAVALGRKPNELIGDLMAMNIFAAINQVVDVEVVEKICERHGVRFVRERRERATKTKARSDAGAGQPTGKEESRPPVVAFLGHVDHGKTSLLDRIRNTRVAAGEDGGITQHIGASVVQRQGKQITFLDTPGHEAFTAMRARGANATDIVVLVVAADDGVMPQTAEAINHAKAAGVPIVVAMNKMDLPGANPDKVKLGLQQNGVQSEDWGGEVAVIPVSATTGLGIEELLDRLLLEAEMLDLKACPSLPCEGIVIEAQLESGMGPTATVLVRNGTLQVGDVFICDQCSGRVKALLNDHGGRCSQACPGTPVKVLGFSGVPEAGAVFKVCEDEREARAMALDRAEEQRRGDLTVTRHASIEDWVRQIAEKSREELRIILKTDVRGSLEAITESLKKIPSEKIRVNVIHSGVGEITENDIELASASEAVIVGFHVRVLPQVNRLAKQRGVEVRLFGIIYELLEKIQDAMRGQLQPEQRETPLGEAVIQQIFATSKTGKVCGCMVQSGSVRVGANAKVYREGELIYNGQVQSLRRFKDDVREVKSGLECGIRLDNFEEFEVGDVIKASTMTEFAARL
ncbi:MAG: translation initiation factor IF-2 [Lentisphaerae bacterium RIFOXYB12_FULL_65_16]|nr:MAG: translation initiation factor IF-2 [Lentisphaerae bacterium RIFOXYA12_64_32]OGV91301.1 MAG: translation initiation factor IF-2 [Lentisphaerae bacterium RIFOXYB12_FULL_65_16]